jgi:hypothetical protein
MWMASEADGIAPSGDTAFTIAMLSMHRKEKYRSPGLDIFGLETITSLFLHHFDLNLF